MYGVKRAWNRRRELIYVYIYYAEPSAPPANSREKPNIFNEYSLCDCRVIDAYFLRSAYLASSAFDFDAQPDCVYKRQIYIADNTLQVQ